LASSCPIDPHRERFAEDYRRRGVPVSPEALAERDAGHLFERGWHIGFVWGQEEGREFREVLAQHRMTNDRHYRVWASGEIDHLEAPSEFHVIPKDANTAELERSARKFHAANAAIYERLRTKGLLPPAGAGTSRSTTSTSICVRAVRRRFRVSRGPGLGPLHRPPLAVVDQHGVLVASGELLGVVGVDGDHAPGL
jgi:hypothetical protein